MFVHRQTFQLLQTAATRTTHRMKAMTPTLHMSVARLKGSKFTTSGAINNNNHMASFYIT